MSGVAMHGTVYRIALLYIYDTNISFTLSMLSFQSACQTCLAPGSQQRVFPALFRTVEDAPG
jgi:hypothetical protein